MIVKDGPLAPPATSRGRCAENSSSASVAAHAPSTATSPDELDPAAADLLITVLADPSAASTVRDVLRRWLVARQWPEDETDDIVLAVSEAIANVSDHAYQQRSIPGNAHIYAWTVTDVTGRRVAVSITDHGRWRPAPADPGYRGRGLLMMNACMVGLHIEYNAGGTSVTMISAPIRYDSRSDAT